MKKEDVINSISEITHAFDIHVSQSQIDLEQAKRISTDIRDAQYIYSSLISDLSGNSVSESIVSSLELSAIPTGSAIMENLNEFGQEVELPRRAITSKQIVSTATSNISAFYTSLDVFEQEQFPNLKNALNDKGMAIGPLEQRLKERLQTLGDHLVEILEGSVKSYYDVGNPLRFTNAGNGLRELMREVLCKIAPDAKIKQTCWFTPDSTSRTGVTRKHRTVYSIYGSIDPKNFPQDFTENVESIASDIGQKVNKLSALTHVTEKVLRKPQNEVSAILSATMESFLVLFETIEESRKVLGEVLQRELDSSLYEFFTENVLSELDILSTHTRPDSVDDIHIDNYQVSDDIIEFNGRGSVYCDLQYLSDSDVRRGDGLETSMTFPFTFEGSVSTEDVSRVSLSANDVEVDTSEFYE